MNNVSNLQHILHRVKGQIFCSLGSLSQSEDPFVKKRLNFFSVDRTWKTGGEKNDG